MFCNKCGSQVPDGMNFCNNCGNPMAPAAPQTPQQPVAPMSQPDPPKKKKTGLIIGIVAGVLAVIVAAVLVWGLAFDGFGLKDKDDKDEDKKDSTTTSAVAESTTTNGGVNNNQTPVTPDVEPDLFEAERVALEYIRYIVSADVKSANNYEFLDWNTFLSATEKVLFESYKAESGDSATLMDMYTTLSENTGYIIKDTEDLFVALEDSQVGAGDPNSVSIDSYKEISSNEASSYNRATSNQIKEFASYGLTDDYNYLGVQSYVQVEATVDNSEEDSDVSVILGFDGNDWTVLYAEIDGEPLCLYTLFFLSGFAE